MTRMIYSLAKFLTVHLQISTVLILLDDLTIVEEEIDFAGTSDGIKILFQEKKNIDTCFV